MKALTRVLGAAAACAMLAFPAGARAGWTYQQGNGNQDDNLLAVGAASGTLACAAGFSQAGGNPSPLYFRTTTGDSWVAGGFQGYGGAIAFLDETNGLLVNMFGKVFRSTDAGASWTEIPGVSLGAGTMLDGDYPADIAVSPGGQAIWIVGGAGKCACSNDGGQTWTQATIPIPVADGALTSAAVAGQRVWLAGGRPSAEESQDPFGEPIPGHPAGSGFVLRSDDAGQSFQTVASGLPYAVNAISFVNLDEGWLAGGTDAEGGAVLGSTTDGGATWTVQPPPDLPEEECFVGMGASMVPGGCWEIEFFGRQVGVALCSTSTFEFDGSNALFLTADGGATWQHQAGYRASIPGSGLAQMAVVTSPIIDVAFPDCHRGWLVGQGRIIMRWDNDDQGLDCEAGGAPSEEEAPDDDDGAEDDDGDSGSCGCAAAGAARPSLAGLLLSLFT
jgi:photosystem II stability/assembly factor-like uncharacterized protein